MPNPWVALKITVAPFPWSPGANVPPNPPPKNRLRLPRLRRRGGVEVGLDVAHHRPQPRRDLDHRGLLVRRLLRLALLTEESPYCLYY